MNPSLPIHLLKREARRLAREQSIPLHRALDRVAQAHGFPRWSLLAHRASQSAATAPRQFPVDPMTADAGARLLAELEPGELLLIAARPRQGKTMLSLSLALAVMKSGGRGMFFTLDFTASDVAGCFARLGETWASYDGLFGFDDADLIDADYVIRRTAAAAPGTLVVIDYLQLLDQRRTSPEVGIQIARLRAHARQRHLVLVFIAQVDRRYDGAARAFPGLGDVRLANPLDLTLFDKACFLNGGEAQVVVPA